MHVYIVIEINVPHMNLGLIQGIYHIRTCAFIMEITGDIKTTLSLPDIGPDS